MIPRDLYEEINAYLKKNKITKVDFIKMAYEIKGNDAKVVVIPDGVSVIVK